MAEIDTFSAAKWRLQAMPQVSAVDLSVRPGQIHSLFHLSDADDLRWAGLHVLPAQATLSLAGQARHDVYIVHGRLQERGNVHSEGGFFSRGCAQTLKAGATGAVFFLYSDHIARRSGLVTWHHEEWTWQPGGALGMRVATLSNTHHRVSLVSWQAGTHAPAHDHPHGEEIFVLKGELRDERGAFPVGSWLRFHPGCPHAPYADVDTLILLRSGHL